MKRHVVRARLCIAIGAYCLFMTGTLRAELADDALRATGVKGGFVVHLGCGDGTQTAAFRASDGYLVHGLDTDAANVAQARQHIQTLGLYGKVSVDLLRSHRLPYVDNLVNLLVAEDLGAISIDEVLRVLCPHGVAYIRQDGRWIKTEKPRSAEMDEWTHYLHDSSNNAVAHDTLVGPPSHLQWVGSPRWTRQHDHMSSFNAMVSAGGRLFYIFDEGPTASIQLPAKWSLIARDAFNGTILWKRPIEHWQTHLWPLKSGPAQLPRRLVAVDDTVYVALGLDAPLSALDAATGRTKCTYAETRATEEVLSSRGVLYLLVDENPTGRPWATKARYANISEIRAEPETWAWNAPPRSIVAIEAQTGDVLWKTRTAVVPLTLTVSGQRVLFHDGQRIVSLDRTNGSPLWRSKPIPTAPAIRSWFAPTLVVSGDVVLFAGGEKVIRHHGGKDTMVALSAQTGKVLWSAAHPPSGYDSPEDVFVIDGLVWTAPTTNRRDTGELTGRDLLTGEVKIRFPSDCGDHMPHHRCHRAKATDRYIVASRTGIEYVDFRAEHWNRNDWVRGACLYGVMPANGLTYAPPQSCACYILAKLNGLNALAPARESTGERPEAEADNRLERGPAYEQSRQESQSSTPSDWPTFRHDASRSGNTSATVPSHLKPVWRADLGGRLSSPVIADGRAFVALIDTHTVQALDASNGKRLWSYTTGGRVDSPPTIWQGNVLFGSADGAVYCVRARDGMLVWRFRAAPRDERLMAFEQIESVWPVHGSVLVQDGIVHCVTGRSMFVDGGMRYLRLDARTGRKLSETVLDDRNPKTGEPLDAHIKWPNLPVALPDVLSCDGQSVYMRSQRFDLNGRRREVVTPSNPADQKGGSAHLFCSTGFLDDTWWHRTYWIYGKTMVSAAGGWYRAAYHAPAGRILAVDDSYVYGFGRKPQYFPQTTTLEYHLFRTPKESEFVRVTSGAQSPRKPAAQPVGRQPAGKKTAARSTARSSNSAKNTPRVAAKPQPAPRRRPPAMRPVYDWSKDVPLLGRALILADGKLFVAGPPDVVDTEVTSLQISDPKTTAQLAAQAAALEGKSGGLLRIVDASSGQKLADYQLDAPPVFDGMAAASRRLYLSTTNGTLVCFGE